jgi:hypothetical protein
MMLEFLNEINKLNGHSPYRLAVDLKEEHVRLNGKDSIIELCVMVLDDILQHNRRMTLMVLEHYIQVVHLYKVDVGKVLRLKKKMPSAHYFQYLEQKSKDFSLYLKTREILDELAMVCFINQVLSQKISLDKLLFVNLTLDTDELVNFVKQHTYYMEEIMRIAQPFKNFEQYLKRMALFSTVMKAEVKLNAMVTSKEKSNATTTLNGDREFYNPFILFHTLTFEHILSRSIESKEFHFLDHDQVQVRKEVWKEQPQQVEHQEL